MSKSTQNICYMKAVRPPTKTAHRFFTGRCQIERASLENDHDSLEYSIKHSKMLDNYKQKYPFSVPFQKEQLDYLFQSKDIGKDKNRFYIAKILRELHCYNYTLYVLENKKNTKYDKTKQEHEQKLLGLWENLKPKEQLKARVSEQWISLGFQVSDPATDFRGAGQLGLENLYRFSSTQKCKQIFKIASDSGSSYFFCSAGLFFTMLCLQITNSKALEHDYWVHESEEQLLNNFQTLYEMIFCQFSRFWLKDCQDRSILFFNHNLKAFQVKVKKWNTFQLRNKIDESRI